MLGMNNVQTESEALAATQIQRMTPETTYLYMESLNAYPLLNCVLGLLGLLFYVLYFFDCFFVVLLLPECSPEFTHKDLLTFNGDVTHFFFYFYLSYIPHDYIHIFSF